MNGYICFWMYGNNKVEVYAKTSYDAQQLAVLEFQKGTRKKVKGYDITVMLAEKPNGESVTHTADF